jgi:hypothetical protein
MNPKLLLCLALVLSRICHAAIVFPKAPEEGRQIAYEKVSGVIQKFPNAYKGLKIEELTISDAHKMYSFGPQNIISGNLLSTADFSGWRYLFIHGTNAVCEVPLIFDPKDGKLSKHGGVFGNELAQAALEALRKAAELPQVKKEDYECRFLVCSLMGFHAIWLHGKSDDIMIPVPPTYDRVNAYQPYSESQIIKLLKSDAENTLKQDPHLPG